MKRYNPTEWFTAREQAKDILRRYGAAEKTINYEALRERITAVQFDNAYELPFRQFLGDINLEEADAGRGMLTVVVIYKDRSKGMMPGGEFFELAEKLGRTLKQTPDGRMKFWAAEFGRVVRECQAHADRQRALAFIRSPEQWPNWPFLTMKKLGWKARDPEAMGLMLDEGRGAEPIIYFTNMNFVPETGVKSVRHTRYDSMEELLKVYTVD